LAPLGTRDFAASLIFLFSDLLPLPHLLFVFTSASSSFIGIYFCFLIVYWYLLLSVYLLVVSVYLLVVSVYDIDVFAHNINV
jgi:hypothetical protein